MEETRDSSVARPRLVTTLLGAFAVIALLLAAVGTYGLISYGVGLRRQELGVRIALGARAPEIMTLVLRQALLSAAVGITAGTLASLFLTRALTSLLYGVRPGDPATLAAVTGVLAGATLAACFVPARRALRTDPMMSMRSD
jgi:putative ABC transport system permease protein